MLAPSNRRTKNILGMIVYFSSLEDCIVFVETSRETAQRYLQNKDDIDSGIGYKNTIQEHWDFDHQSIALIRKKVSDVPTNAHCGIFLEIEYDTDPYLEDWFELFEQTQPLLMTLLSLKMMKVGNNFMIRHAIPAGVNEIVISNGMPKVGTDFSVPDHALRDIMTIYQNVSMQNILFGHIGDNHLHMNLFQKSRRITTSQKLYREMALQAVYLGGSVSAEHGIGKLKAHLLSDMMGKKL